MQVQFLQMSRVSKGSSESKAAENLDFTAEDAAKAIRKLMAGLPEVEREALRATLSDILTPRVAPRGEATARVVRLIQSDRTATEWTAQQVQEGLHIPEGDKAEAKKVLNSLSYLTKAGFLKRVGYGRYHVRDYGFGVVDTDFEG
jgi:hypothetical protein